jgi:hypothetical protein
MMYKITLVSTTITGSTRLVCGLAEWGECDLYVRLRVGAAENTSPVIKDNNNPVWDEYMLSAEKSVILQSFEVDVYDEDPMGAWVTVGSCTPQIQEADLQAGKHVSDCEDAKQLTWKFEITN